MDCQRVFFIRNKTKQNGKHREDKLRIDYKGMYPTAGRLNFHNLIDAILIFQKLQKPP